MASVEEEYKKIQASGKRPLPGQSLTNDPENPAPYEKAPEFTSVHAASEYMFGKFIEPNTYTALMTAIDDGAAVMDIVQSVLFSEFQEGKFNPDLMLMLVEPVAYMLIALAEKLDLDITVYRGELEDEDEEEQILGVSFSEERLKKLQKAGQSGRVPANTITPQMEQQLEELPEIPALKAKQGSLLSAPDEALDPNKQSLMSPPTGI